MNAKFFDRRRYDLTKAGRYKLGKKLNAINRIEHHRLAQDIVGADGTVFMPSGTMINRDEREALKAELKKGYYVNAFPFNPLFSHDDVVAIETSVGTGLLGRVLAKDVELDDVTYYTGDVITECVLKDLMASCEKVNIERSGKNPLSLGKQCVPGEWGFLSLLCINLRFFEAE